MNYPINISFIYKYVCRYKYMHPRCNREAESIHHQYLTKLSRQVEALNARKVNEWEGKGKQCLI